MELNIDLKKRVSYDRKVSAFTNSARGGVVTARCSKSSWLGSIPALTMNLLGLALSEILSELFID